MMSTLQSVRAAIRACRPIRSSTALSLRQEISSGRHTEGRGFTSNAPTRTSMAKDITAGFPTPQAPQIVDENLEEAVSPSRKDKTPVATTDTVRPTSSSTSQDSTLSHPPSRADALSTSLQSRPAETAQEDSESSRKPLVPPNVLAAYRTPIRHPITHGIPVASLQLRSYSPRNLELYADFAVRAAYYLGLPCSGPAPLPRRTERWTVLKSNFVHKKAQENFERITMKRLITVYDAEPSVVEIWLAFLRKWQMYGVGLKANVWQWEGIDVADKMDRDFAALEKDLDDKLRLFGYNKHAAEHRNLLRQMGKQGSRQVGMAMSQVRELARPEGDEF